MVMLCYDWLLIVAQALMADCAEQCLIDKIDQATRRQGDKANT